MRQRSVRLTLSAAVTAAALTLTGCGSDPVEETGPDPDVSADATITIADFAYGDPLTVAPGATIMVINEDSAQHDVDAMDGESFDTELLGQGESLTFTAPMEPGSYDFTCSVHPQMSGTLTVEE